MLRCKNTGGFGVGLVVRLSIRLVAGSGVEFSSGTFVLKLLRTFYLASGKILTFSNRGIFLNSCSPLLIPLDSLNR